MDRQTLRDWVIRFNEGPDGLINIPSPGVPHPFSGSAAHDQRTQSAYLFGGVCPERGAGAALVLPACNCEAMQLHLDEIATKVALGAYAIILLDQAGCMAPRPWWFRTTSHSCRCRRASALYHMYAERIEAFRHNPPATDWNGVYEAESK
jgi:hypothetical protein